MKDYKYIFGPVPSRRLGRSLGVDLVPFKTCSYDCVYCQLGRTTDKTIERKEYVPVSKVLEELEQKLSEPDRPDYVTFSGSGEPTLHSGIGEIIAGVKKMTDVPVAVLTNGSLLWMPEVRRQIIEADLVVPSLDAGDKELFERVNRPDPAISFPKMLDGLFAFRKEYPGKIWIEVFLLKDLSASEEAVRKIAEYVKKIKPDKIQINTATRPPAELFARPVPEPDLRKLACILGPGAEIIADYRGTHQRKEFVATSSVILDMLRRRPCSLEDVAQGLDIHKNEATKHLGELLSKGKITIQQSGDRVYYKIASRNDS